MLTYVFVSLKWKFKDHLTYRYFSFTVSDTYSLLLVQISKSFLTFFVQSKLSTKLTTVTTFPLNAPSLRLDNTPKLWGRALSCRISLIGGVIDHTTAPPPTFATHTDYVTTLTLQSRVPTADNTHNIICNMLYIS